MMSCIGIYRYPVKGFSVDVLGLVSLAVGGGLPYDRRWGLSYGGSDSVIDSRDPSSWVGRRNLVTLSRTERLAQLSTEFEESSRKLVIKRGGRAIAQGILTSASGRDVLESFLNGFFANSLFDNIRILDAEVRGFTDFADSYVSFINANSVKDLERVVGREIDPCRFRGNFLLDVPMWSERDWVGKRLRIGGVEFICGDEIERCHATNIDTTSGDEDMNIPLSLRRGYGHRICGIYAQVTKSGTISIGDKVEVLG